MDDSSYRAHPALNYSLAKWLLESPWHFQKARTEEVEETLDMQLGTMLHQFFLEGKMPQYVMRPTEIDGEPWQGNRKVCKAWKQARKDEGIIVFDDKTELRQVRMVESLKGNATFRAMVDNATAKEHAIIGEYRGVPIKGKVDLWGTDKSGTHYLGDLKKCRSASPRGFGNRRADGKLSMQMEWYSTLLAMEQGWDDSPLGVWVAIEDTFAAPVETYRHSEESRRIGRAQMDRAIDLFKQCSESGVWPSYNAGLVDVQTFPWEHQSTPTIEEI